MGTLLDGSPWMSFLVLNAGKGAALLAAVWLVALLARRSPASMRHALWAVGLVGLLAIPVLSLQFQWVEVPFQIETATTPGEQTAPLPPAPVKVSGPAELIAIERDVPAASPPIAAKAMPILANEIPSRPPLSISSILVMGWALGALLCLLPYVAGRLALRRMAREADCVVSADWTAALEEASRRLRLRGRVRLLRSKDNVIPMVWGVLRPTILLPRCATEWDATCRDLVLQHELAHVKRWDCLTDLIGLLARAVHWFNPLAWVGVRRLYAEREAACDEWVLRDGARPSTYAEQLLQVVRGLDRPRFASVAGLAMGRRAQLERRVDAILDQRPASRIRRVVGTSAVLATVAGILIIAGVQLLPNADAQQTIREVTVVVSGQGLEGVPGDGSGSIVVSGIPSSAVEAAGSDGLTILPTESTSTVQVSVDSYNALKRLVRAAGEPGQTPTVVLRVTEPTVPTSAVLNVLAAIQQAGVETINIAVGPSASSQGDREPQRRSNRREDLSTALRRFGRAGSRVSQPLEAPDFTEASPEVLLKYLGLVFKMYAIDAEGEFFPPRSGEPGAFYPVVESIFPRYVNTPDVAPFLRSEGKVRVCYPGYVMHDDTEGLRFLDAYKKLGSDLLTNMQAIEYEGSTLHPLREGIERFFITDINNPAGSAVAQAEIPILWTMPDDGKGGYVLFMDGHTEWVGDGEKFPMTGAFIDELNEVMAPKPGTSTSSVAGTGSAIQPAGAEATGVARPSAGVSQDARETPEARGGRGRMTVGTRSSAEQGARISPVVEARDFATASLNKRLRLMGIVFKMFANEAKGELFPPRARDTGAFYPDIDSICPRFIAGPDVAPFLRSEGDVRVCYTGYLLHDEETGLRYLDAYASLGSEALIDASSLEYEGVHILRLREGIERFLITDINNPNIQGLQSRIPVLWTMPDDGKGGYVLFMDGHTEWVGYGEKFPMTEAFIGGLNEVMQPTPGISTSAVPKTDSAPQSEGAKATGVASPYRDAQPSRAIVDEAREQGRRLEELRLGGRGQSSNATRPAFMRNLASEPAMTPTFDEASVETKLKQIGLAFKKYAIDAQGAFYPPRCSDDGLFYPMVESIYPVYISDPSVSLFLCGKQGVRVCYPGFAMNDDESGLRFIRMYRNRGTALSPELDAIGFEGTDIYRLREGIESFYITDINNPAGRAMAQAEIPILWTMPDDGKGGYVLFLDGHTEWVGYGEKFPMTEAFIGGLNEVMQPTQ